MGTTVIICKNNYSYVHCMLLFITIFSVVKCTAVWCQLQYTLWIVNYHDLKCNILYMDNKHNDIIFDLYFRLKPKLRLRDTH